MIRNKNGYVYALREKGTTTVRYIGKTCAGTIERRLAQHLKESKRYNRHVHSWIKSVISKGNTIEIVLLEGPISIPETPQQNKRWDESALNNAEVEWIRLHRLIGTNLTNHTDGGEGASGYRFSDELRLKMSLSQKSRSSTPEGRSNLEKMALKNVGNTYVLGHKQPPETILKRAISNTGKKHSDEWTAKIAKANRGKKRSDKTRQAISISRKGSIVTEEHRAKISKALKGRPRSPETIAKILATKRAKKNQ